MLKSQQEEPCDDSMWASSCSQKNCRILNVKGPEAEVMRRMPEGCENFLPVKHKSTGEELDER